MKLLVIGSGGREHALAWRLAQSARVHKVYVAPGNGGTALADNLENVALTDPAELAQFAEREHIALTVVGPEAPLAAGVVDIFRERGLKIFGPTRAAAQLESSKDYAKAFMTRHNIPTARYQTFTDPAAAHAYIDEQGAPIVVKADGLAAGKGVVVAATRAEAEAAIDDALGGRFGAAGARVVIEEFLEGEIGSLFALCDGETSMLFGWAQDHKRAFDGEQGPNTGGMGTYSPAPVFTPELVEQIRTRLVEPAFAGIAQDGAPYRGVLFVELMATRHGPKLVEFNVRFGDPECQVLMLRLESDLLPYLKACATGALKDMPQPVWRDEAAACVVVAAKGYPETPKSGGEIGGLEQDFGPDVVVFHAGTSRDEAGVLRAAGGRVLNVCAKGPDLKAALAQAYGAIDRIQFPDGFFRRDIGWRALAR